MNAVILIGLCLFGLGIWLLSIFITKSNQTTNPQYTPEETYPYVMRPALFTPAEISYYHVLQLAAGERVAVLGKIRIADVIQTKKGLNNSERTSAFNKISKKHFDFVLCDPKTLKILCAIELNDKSHNKPERQVRDEFLEEVCNAAGLKLIPIKAQRTYELTQVKFLIDNILAHS